MLDENSTVEKSLQTAIAIFDLQRGEGSSLLVENTHVCASLSSTSCNVLWIQLLHFLNSVSNVPAYSYSYSTCRYIKLSIVGY